MNRRKFIGIAGGSIIAVGATGYLLSDKSNFGRADIKSANNKSETLKPDEREILFLASLAPSRHNPQPWIVQYLEPYHWIIGNDKTKFKVGDQVFSRPDVKRNGTYAEFVAVNEDEVAFKPKTISHVESASLPLAANSGLGSTFHDGTTFQ